MITNLSENTGLLASRVKLFIRETVDEPTPSSSPSAESAFNELALDIFGFQYAAVDSYRKFCDARGVNPANTSNWRQIPAIITTAFKEHELTSIHATGRTGWFCSSGTTGQARSRHFHNAESLAIYENSLSAWFKRMTGLTAPAESPRFLFLTPPPSQAPHSSLVHMLATLRRELNLAAIFAGAADSDGNWSLDFQSACRFIEKAVDAGQPVFVMGTAFNFVHLLDEAASSGKTFRLPEGSAVMETGGYKGRSRILAKDELHGEIARLLSIPRDRIICEYGMSELSSQAYDLDWGSEGNSPRAFHFPPWARALVISPETGLEVGEGEAGLIRIFDLANLYSVMAIQTEDMGIRRGQGFELLGRAASAEARGCSLQSLSSVAAI